MGEAATEAALKSTGSAEFRVRYTVTAAVGALPQSCSGAITDAAVFSWAPQSWKGSGADEVTVIATSGGGRARSDAFKFIGGTEVQSRRVGRRKEGGLRVQDRHLGPRELETYAVYIEAKSAKNAGECSGAEAVCYKTEAYNFHGRKGKRGGGWKSKPATSSSSSSSGGSSQNRTPIIALKWKDMSPIVKYGVFPLLGLLFLWICVIQPCCFASRSNDEEIENEEDCIGNEGWGWNGEKA